MKWLADQTERLAKSKKNGYKKFLKYLGDYYFNDSASFNPGYYQYFDSILNGNMVTSTNCLERINRNLKDAAAGGFLPLGRVCRVLQTWKHHYMCEPILTKILTEKYQIVFHNLNNLFQLACKLEVCKLEFGRP